MSGKPLRLARESSAAVVRNLRPNDMAKPQCLGVSQRTAKATILLSIPELADRGIGVELREPERPVLRPQARVGRGSARAEACRLLRPNHMNQQIGWKPLSD
jgi:hypothetical protein